MNRIALAAIALSAVLSSAAAYAATGTVLVTASAPNDSGLYQTKAVAVAYNDLDISSAQGAAVLYERIFKASRVVCGGRAGVSMQYRRAKVFEECRAQATTDAIAASDLPQLKQYAASR